MVSTLEKASNSYTKCQTECPLHFPCVGLILQQMKTNSKGLYGVAWALAVLFVD